MTRSRPDARRWLVWLSGVLVIGMLAPPAAASRPLDLARYVNPFNGTQAGAPDHGTGGGAGNTFPGATLPFGMVQWSPDTVPSNVNFAGGYTYGDTRVRGFSVKHLSGAGCPQYLDFPFLPTTVPVTDSPAEPFSADIDDRYVPSFDHANEEASPGFYRVTLDPGTPKAIDSSLTVTRRSGIGRFTYPATSSASMLINAGGSAMANLDASIRIDPDRREISGSAMSGAFCYRGNHYRLHFVARLSRPFTAHGTWREQTLEPGSTSSSDTSLLARNPTTTNYFPLPGGPQELPYDVSSTAQTGAYVTFDTTQERTLEVRLGLSFVSVDNARQNLEAESGDKPFAAIRRAARATWNRMLGRAVVRGGSAEDRGTFYTSLYHALIHPSTFSDSNGEYLGMDGRIHHAGRRTRYADLSGWDIYRSQIPLLAMLYPREAADIGQSMVANARESGWLPKWSVANGHTAMMTGDPAAPMLASAYALGATNFDAEAALHAAVKGATKHGRPSNDEYSDSDYFQRPALPDYLRLGYVPQERGTSGSVDSLALPDNPWGAAASTLEYALADFAIARLAADLGDRRTCRSFLERASNWRTLFDSDSGYIRPRYGSGAFKPDFDPASTDGFVEGNAAQYTWMIQQDVAGLVEALGGVEPARRRLDEFFSELNAGPRSPHAFLGNEPTLHTPYLWAWLGQPYKTQAIVRRTLDELYSAEPAGFPGNDDLGSMSAWYVLSALGVYPAVPGTDVLVLSSPLFRTATLRPSRDRVVIRAREAPSAAHIRRLAVNGRRHGAPWLRWASIRDGDRIDFTLAREPAPSWGSESPPPSFGRAATATCG